TLFEKYGGFRTELGPRPGSEIRGEDTDFGRRLLQAGEHLWYEPSAVVYHPGPPNRVGKKYFLRWWFDKSRADVREFGTSADIRQFVGGACRFVSWAVRWLFAPSATQRFSHKLKTSYVAGQVSEYYNAFHGRSYSSENCSQAESLR